MATNGGRTLSDEEKEQFAYELALGYFDDEGLRIKFGLAPAALARYKESEEIQRLILLAQRQIDESDQALRINARRAARLAIQQAANILNDDDAPIKTRMEASRQLRQYAVIADKEGDPGAGDGPIYIKTNLDLGGDMRGVYALTAVEAEAQREPEPEDDFSDLLGVPT